MELTLEQLRPYIGGWIQIKDPRWGRNSEGGIKNMFLENNVLTVELVWKKEFRAFPDANPRWVHVPEFSNYMLDLKECRQAEWLKDEEKQMGLYCQKTEEEVIFGLANDHTFNILHDLLRLDGCPPLLEEELKKIKQDFLAKLDLANIPKINFGIEQILPETCAFIRVDLKWKDVLWSFLRIQEKPGDAHSLIYYRLLDEIAEQYSLTRHDIEGMLVGCGGGHLQYLDDALVVWGSSRLYGEESDRSLTKSILAEALCCLVK